MDTPEIPLPLHAASLTLLSDHLVWMRRRRLSVETIKTRHGHVLRFMRWAHQQPPLDASDGLLTSK